MVAISFGRKARENQRFMTFFERIVKDFNTSRNKVLLEQYLPWLENLRTKRGTFMASQRNYEEMIAKMAAGNDVNCDGVAEQNLCHYVFDVIAKVGLLAGKNKHTKEDYINSIMVDSLNGGSDSAAGLIQWALFYCITNTPMQNKIHAEIDDVICYRLPAAHDREKMPYTQAFILELLRFCMPAPFTLERYITENLDFKGYKLKKGTIVMVNLWSANRDALVWKDPDEFRPERFLSKEGAVDKELEDRLMTFGAGPRICPAKNLAKLKMFLLLVRVLQRCSFDKSDGHEYSFDVIAEAILRPCPFPVRILRRIVQE